MNERIRELFEKHTIPNFGIFTRNVGHLNEHGEYHNPIIEDHWQTFQEAAELIVQECGVALSPMLRDMVSRGQAFDLIKLHFGVEE